MTTCIHHISISLLLVLTLSFLLSHASSLLQTIPNISASPFSANTNGGRCHTRLLHSDILQDDHSLQQRHVTSEPHTLVPNENSSRRALLINSAITLAGITSVPLPSIANTSKSRSEGYTIQHTEKEWASLLTNPQYNILRNGNTERQRSSILNLEERAGTYVCAGCSTPLFSSLDKFKSGTGWPSFAAAVVEDAVEVPMGGGASEVRCRACGGHIGDVFNDGWRFVGTAAFKTGKRFCIDGSALVFKPEGGEKIVRGDMPPTNKVITYEQTIYRQST